MWHKGWREQTWPELNQPWDVIIIGGGITGAGVLRQAVATGLKTLLVEANDFSSGTSSRSSKLIHGGLRYILNKQYRVTQESVREREWMLRAAPHLVDKLGFIFPNLERYHAANRKIGIVLAIYDLLVPKWDHHRYGRQRLIKACPILKKDDLKGGYLYYDAVMDDCRVVLRVIKEAVRAGGTALNYTRVEKLLRTADGNVCGVALKDVSIHDGKTVEAQAKVVINASGAWSDEIRGQLGQPGRLRRVRGSHLVFPRAKLPANTGITLIHPKDNRAMFVIPWEGTTIMGTTEVDQTAELDRAYAEPFAGVDEIAYIMDAAGFLFPDLHLSEADIISSFSGLRPIVRGGADSASKESRAHALWLEDGMVTITGGKYTTFRIMSQQALELALTQMGRPGGLPQKRVFNALPDMKRSDINPVTLDYLAGRYGDEAPQLIAAAEKG
ncbi:MAG: glycerol-3-phosphate dehydrogenase/oxidase, partial [Chloroflexi bacterium]|nr:glycerol-3-phosphate dehydrogenase/oxidase [Chloroflexota bacterium]